MLVSKPTLVLHLLLLILLHLVLLERALVHAIFRIQILVSVIVSLGLRLQVWIHLILTLIRLIVILHGINKIRRALVVQSFLVGQLIQMIYLALVHLASQVYLSMSRLILI